MRELYVYRLSQLCNDLSLPDDNSNFFRFVCVLSVVSMQLSNDSHLLFSRVVAMEFQVSPACNTIIKEKKCLFTLET